MPFQSRTLSDAVAQIDGKRILVCPLNWGLGHATRCVPVIHEIERQGKTAVIAAYGLSRTWLQQEFPTHKIIDFPGIEIRYSASNSQIGAMLKAIPHILHDIHTEHRQLSAIIEQHHIDAIISDNRFGLFTNKVPCIYITHQLMIKMPHRLTWLEPIGHWMHHRFINRYNACWVPDYAHEPSLSGALSHRYEPTNKTFFVGPLSRFDTPNTTTTNHSDYENIAILSGPEPQRTLLEKALIQQFLNTQQKSLIVQGIPTQQQEIHTNHNVTIVSHMTSTELVAQILSVPNIYCRSGYTTLMDLDRLKRTATLIPTPGQTEQEYLAKIAVNRQFKWVEQQTLTTTKK
ncbi:MAG: glycosyltransferase family protein [Bacteroidales bacterium]|nr:glycosyltransferase family protein [Bacteroidales bacterium]